MAEYINTHGPELMAERIPHHAFSFISPRFPENVQPHLQEITDQTSIKGTAWPVTSLLVLGDKVRKREVLIENLYPVYSSSALITPEDIHN